MAQGRQFEALRLSALLTCVQYVAAMASLTLDWMQLAAVVGALQGLLLTGVIVAQ